MSEDGAIFLFMCFGAAAAYAMYLRLVVVRRLRNRIDGLVEARLVAAAPTAQADAQPNPEVEQLKQRVHVLERIATDGNPLLRHEIEALRHL